ncbi:hypothetical protein GJR96_06015 [Haloferax sp. MBLA0076]|uniref:Uncharacterized protein n=1 Tax=Haloferax litoreum TaxID=2666140 RepID=A0A6A8GFF5_9EURY|nr:MULTISPECIES: hypothetical protein [Haloferax]KAB1193020.1 hypothetical protein Hfx1148_06010 [Haloferax sp. CBA1148]MRX21511.1 hypothetical protein [Haloferax litoreum]
MRWSLRAVVGSLQLPVAGLGLTIVAFTWWGAYTLPPAPPGSDGFAHGLAGFFLLLFGLVGFVLLVVGLLIPPGPGYGIDFTRRQRWLFAYALVAPLVGVAAFFAAVFAPSNPLGIEDYSFAVLSLGVGSAPLAVLVSIGWKAVHVAVERYGTRTSQ